MKLIITLYLLIGVLVSLGVYLTLSEDDWDSVMSAHTKTPSDSLKIGILLVLIVAWPYCVFNI